MTDETTTTTATGKRLPRYESRARSGAETFLSPLPDRLISAMGDLPEVRRHAELGQHFQKAQAKTIEIAAQLEKTRADDEKRRVEALAAGRQRPVAKAEKIELDLRQQRQDLAILEDLLRSSADELLHASVPFVDEARAAAERDAETAVAEVARFLEVARSAVEEADRLSGEFGWLASFSRSGVVWPWSPRTRSNPLPNVKQHLGAAIGSFPDDVQRVSDHRESREREEAAEQPLPPGSVIWREGRELRVREDGEIEEVPR